MHNPEMHEKLIMISQRTLTSNWQYYVNDFNQDTVLLIPTLQLRGITIKVTYTG